MRKFCFICGSPTDKLADGRCEDCLKKSAFLSLPRKIEVTQCNKCKKMFLDNKWTEFDIVKILEKSVKLSGKIKKIDAKEEKKKIKASFVLVPAFSDREVEEAHEADFHVNKIICPSCSRRHSGYYEAVLQLRGFDENGLEKLVGVFDMLKEKTFYRVNEVKGGFDIKVGNKLVVVSAASDVRKKFPSEMKKSFSIVTKIDGRDVHRKFILIRKIQKKD